MEEKVQGPRFYNSLNSVTTGSSSSASFKRKLEEFYSMYYRFYMAKIRLFIQYILCVCVCVCVCVWVCES